MDRLSDARMGLNAGVGINDDHRFHKLIVSLLSFKPAVQNTGQASARIDVLFQSEFGQFVIDVTLAVGFERASDLSGKKFRELQSSSTQGLTNPIGGDFVAGLLLEQRTANSSELEVGCSVRKNKML